MTSKKADKGEFEFLRVAAQKMGTEEIRIIPASEIIIEDNIPLKCKTGCPSYGKKLTCPPFVPTPDEFRKTVSEYRFALLVKFGPLSDSDPDIIRTVYKGQNELKSPAENIKKAEKTQDECSKERRNILPEMLELEKVIFNAGYIKALAFAGGSCKICEICNVEKGICLHPEIARIPEHAVGINLRKTAEISGISINFPSVHHPEPVAILLID